MTTDHATILLKARALAGLLRRDDLTPAELEFCRRQLREIDTWLKERHEERRELYDVANAKK